MNADEIDRACQSTSVYFWEGLALGSVREIPEVGTIQVIDTNDSSLDDYSGRRFLVLKIGDKLFRKDGMYYSHDGTYWDGPLYEVRRITKTVVDYEEVV